MTPFGGISALVCLMLIALRKLHDGLFKHISNALPQFIRDFFTKNSQRLSFAIIALVFVVVMGSVYSVLSTALVNPDNNIAYVENLIAAATCTPFTSSIGADRVVVLRLDDVQAYSWREISLRMMDDTVAHRFPIVAGVIPKHLADDHELIRYLKRNACHVQVAMHGDEHTESANEPTRGEFADLNENEALTKLNNGKEELQKVIQKPISTFIPPQNQISSNAIDVLPDAGFTILSKIGNGIFDVDTSTWKTEEGGIMPAQSTFADCEDVFRKGDHVCVIMLHPQDYANSDQSLNLTSYAEYLKLLHLLSTDPQIKVLSFDDIVANNIRNIDTLTPYKGSFEFTRELKMYDRGEDVRMLQSFLNTVGYQVAEMGPGSNGHESVYFGEGTRDALIRFQKEKELVETGVLDHATASILLALIQSKKVE